MINFKIILLIDVHSNNMFVEVINTDNLALQMVIMVKDKVYANADDGQR